MCGIAGHIGPRRIDDGRIAATLELMRLRGPDHSDVARLDAGNTQVLLLHSRLSIIDLDPRANQPMTRDGCTLSFNGEIYNYRELRNDLESRGIAFTTDSDSEVLLASYLAHGESCVEQFEGMWAFALYDSRAHTLLLSRDRFGEKPLYLLDTPDGLFFGSEIKHLVALSGQRPSVNRKHIARFLVNGYKSLYKSDEEFFDGVRRLPPATHLHIDAAGRQTSRRFWSPPTTAPNAAGFEETVAAVRERLVESVALRMRADVPVAFCLSGGVDSGALASIATKRLNREIATFSIIDRDKRYDESANISRTVDDLGCENVAIEIPRHGVLDRLTRLVAYHDAPVYTLSYYVHALLSEAIADCGYRVVLSGVGADELFTGYYDHFNLHLFEMRDHERFDACESAWTQHVRPIVRNPHLQQPRLYFERPAFRDHIYLNRETFAEMLRVDFDEPFSETRYCKSLLRNRMLNELLHETVPPILHDDDLNSMRCSLENRSPYLDSKLCELAFAIPPEHLIRDGRAKSVLRAAVAGWLNDDVRLDRRKVGFNAAFHSVVNVDCPQTRACLLDDGPIFELVDRERIAALLAESEIPNSISKFLFAFVGARIFLDMHG